MLKQGRAGAGARRRPPPALGVRRLPALGAAPPPPVPSARASAPRPTGGGGGQAPQQGAQHQSPSCGDGAQHPRGSGPSGFRRDPGELPTGREAPAYICGRRGGDCRRLARGAARRGRRWERRRPGGRPGRGHGQRTGAGLAEALRRRRVEQAEEGIFRETGFAVRKGALRARAARPAGGRGPGPVSPGAGPPGRAGTPGHARSPCLPAAFSVPPDTRTSPSLPGRRTEYRRNRATLDDRASTAANPWQAVKGEGC